MIILSQSPLKMKFLSSLIHITFPLSLGHHQAIHPYHEETRFKRYNLHNMETFLVV